MAAKSGAGASVSSGASYQARVGAYVVASSLCGASSEFALIEAAERISFETTEDVDDINITLKEGEKIYIQAKATIGYSIGQDGEFRSVLNQFQAQTTNGSDKLILVTSSRASKKIIFDLRAALNAFRSSPEKEFYRDQPRALTAIITELRAVLGEIQNTARKSGPSTIDEIIRRMSVVVLDIESADPLERAVILLLESKKFLAAEAVWGKLVSDCIGYARGRRTVTIADIVDYYNKFRPNQISKKSGAAEEFLKVEFRGADFSSGRDLVLCHLPAGFDPLPMGYAIIEAYRFDDKCNERLKYDEDNHSVIFAGSLRAPLLRRTATYQGMNRLLELNPTLIGDNELSICPINTEEDHEASACAKVHLERLKFAAESNPAPLHCVHCGRPVFSISASLVELPPLDSPIVGLSHEECLRASDRIIGLMQSDFVESHPELINFDANAWYKACHGGQIVFGNLQYLAGNQPAYIAWGGLEPCDLEGAFVVEVTLQGGGREIVTQRNGVHRFPKADAESFALQLNRQFDEARERQDPLCYTNESKAFGLRTQILRQLGAQEKIIPVDKARARPYEVRFAARYSRPGQWYAPLLYLRNRTTGEPVTNHEAVLMITDPLMLATYLENWQSVGISTTDYETVLLLNDDKFDEFMRRNESQGRAAIINPIFDSGGEELLSGHPMLSTESIIALHQR